MRLNDVESREQIATLSNRQLRMVLATSYVNCRGIIERGELVQKAEQLWDAQQNNAGLS